MADQIMLSKKSTPWSASISQGIVGIIGLYHTAVKNNMMSNIKRAGQKLPISSFKNLSVNSYYELMQINEFAIALYLSHKS